jgi:hypothetical protein
MEFTWKKSISEENETTQCQINEKKSSNIEKVILGRLQFKHARVGCCGQVRNDSIYPIGYSTTIDNFKKEALDIIENYDGDTYSIEYYKGDSIDDTRGNGESLFFLIYNDEIDKWEFYKNGKLTFTTSKDRILEDWKK